MVLVNWCFVHCTRHKMSPFWNQTELAISYQSNEYIIVTNIRPSTFLTTSVVAGSSLRPKKKKKSDRVRGPSVLHITRVYIGVRPRVSSHSPRKKSEGERRSTKEDYLRPQAVPSRGSVAEPCVAGKTAARAKNTCSPAKTPTRWLRCAARRLLSSRGPHRSRWLAREQRRELIIKTTASTTTAFVVLKRPPDRSSFSCGARQRINRRTITCTW